MPPHAPLQPGTLNLIDLRDVDARQTWGSDGPDHPARLAPCDAAPLAAALGLFHPRTKSSPLRTAICCSADRERALACYGISPSHTDRFASAADVASIRTALRPTRTLCWSDSLLPAGAPFLAAPSHWPKPLRLPFQPIKRQSTGTLQLLQPIASLASAASPAPHLIPLSIADLLPELAFLAQALRSAAPPHSRAAARAAWHLTERDLALGLIGDWSAPIAGRFIRVIGMLEFGGFPPIGLYQDSHADNAEAARFTRALHGQVRTEQVGVPIESLAALLDVAIWLPDAAAALDPIGHSFDSPAAQLTTTDPATPHMGISIGLAPGLLPALLSILSGTPVVVPRGRGADQLVALRAIALASLPPLRAQSELGHIQIARDASMAGLGTGVMRALRLVPEPAPLPRHPSALSFTEPSLSDA